MDTDFPAGALVCCGVDGALDAGDRRRLGSAGLAGNVIFRRNVPDASALATLAAELAALAAPGPPPILAIDEEGGLVSRLNHLGFEAPSALALGSIGDEEIAREVGREIGVVIAALGLNTVLAPCLDVLTEPLNPVIATRALGDEPSAVARLGLAMLEGFRVGGVLAVIKHFPGHGGTIADSHTDEPVLQRSFAEMEACDLVPFRAAIAAGAPAVMTAHVRYPDATPLEERSLPATQSRYWLDEVLRRRLGFTGPVVSDALEMAGASGGTLEERVERTLGAGVDLLLFDELEHGLAARAHVARLSETARWRPRLALAAERVLRFRHALARPGAMADRVRPTAEVLIQAASRFAAIQGDALALVGDPGRMLPLSGASPLFVAMPRALDADRRLDLPWLQSRLDGPFPRAHLVGFDPGPEAPARLAAEWARFASGSAGGASAAIVLASVGRGDPKWIGEAAAVFGNGPGRRVGVALHRPGEALEMPASWARLVTYGFGRNSLDALIDVLAGKRSAGGRVLGVGRAPSNGIRARAPIDSNLPLR